MTYRRRSSRRALPHPFPSLRTDRGVILQRLELPRYTLPHLHLPPLGDKPLVGRALRARGGTLRALRPGPVRDPQASSLVVAPPAVVELLGRRELQHVPRHAVENVKQRF